MPQVGHKEAAQLVRKGLSLGVLSKARPPLQLPDDETLTQFGTKDSGFRHRPVAGETELSLLLGRHTPLGAVACISKATMALPGRDGVRYSTAETLRNAGFTVESTPEKANPLHVSVTMDKEWEEDEEIVFEECMSDPIWEGGQNE